MNEGKLKDPQMEFYTDRRADRRLAQAMQLASTMQGDTPDPPADATLEELLEYCAQAEATFDQLAPIQEAAMPAYPEIESRTEMITGVDGNDIALYIHLPKTGTPPGPCVVHTHGGGMVLMAAADPLFRRWRNDVAQAGMRVVGVEFRNGGGKLGNHAFPAGLNDCASAVKWVHTHKEELGITHVVISGESGGGNLSIATTLKAKQEGWLDHIQGVYACCPYISGAYADPPPELGSLHENDGYQLARGQMAALVRVYDPNLENSANPLAWPYQATTDELVGLPPHVISVNELDPLRDEGLEFYRKLQASGVSATGRVVLGTNHAGDVGFADVAPDLYFETLNSLVAFAHRVG
jgi:acetyl esterase/lipase